MSGGTRGLETVRQATVRVSDRAGRHVGQGLLLDLGDEGRFVLTCHHVIAQVAADDLSVALPMADGTVGPPVRASYDPTRSRPDRDAVVLGVDGVPARDRPLLHQLNVQAYRGTLPEKVVCLGHFQTNSLDGWLSAATRLEVPREAAGGAGPAAYVLPSVFRLREPSDARPGISGSVAVYEGGVIGLVHFSRPAGPVQEREVYIVPIGIWAEAWPALAALIEPLVDERLRAAAVVRRVKALRVPEDVRIAGYRPDIQIDRPVMARARDLLERLGAVIIVGRPKSGKTRLAWDLIRERPEALAVIPHDPLPPAAFEGSTLAGEDLVLFFDDLHRSALSGDPLAWRRRLEAASGSRCRVVGTSRDGDEWRAVERGAAAQLIESVGRAAVVLVSRSGVNGEDLTEELGRQLAGALGLTRQEFERRFDGTPGSLTLDLEDMRDRYVRLRDEQRGAVAMSRLVDAAKLVYEASQPVLRGPILRAVAERIRGDGRLSGEAWDALQRRTAEEGFGVFQRDTGNFQTYTPYLERCVDYAPSVADVEALVPLLIEARDYEGLGYVGQALFMRLGAPAAAERALRAAADGGNESAATMLSWALGGISGREEDAEAMHRRLIEGGEPGAYVNFGGFLADQPGREEEAEHVFREALRLAVGSNVAPVASWSLGNLLQRLPGREAEAEACLREAMDGGMFMAHISLGKLLARDPSRLAEAEAVVRSAFPAIDAQFASIDPQPGKAPAQDPQVLLEAMRGDAFDCLGEILAEQPGREAEAEEAFRSAIAGGNAYARHHLAFLLANKLGRLDDAERVLREAVALGDYVAGGYLGELLLRRPDGAREAEGLFRDAIAHGGERGHFHLGQALAMQGRAADAERAFRRAIEIGVVEANELLADLIVSQPGREAEVETLYEAAAAAGSQSAPFELAEVLARQPEREGEAEAHYREAVSRGDSRGACRLGWMLTRRVIGGTTDAAAEAESTLRAALAGGIEDAAVPLGVLLINVDRAAEGVELLQRARAAGLSGAAEMLAIIEQPGEEPAEDRPG